MHAVHRVPWSVGQQAKINDVAFDITGLYTFSSKTLTINYITFINIITY